MQTSNGEPSLVDLQAQIDQLREEAKEREPSMLGAIRTLVSDMDIWKRGERDYPKAATIGLVLAYLRPRVVLIVGSFAAILFAGGQTWLLARQNALISQQNALLREQGYALRAQTTAALITGLDSAVITDTQTSLLTAFGDIGFDSLRILASTSGKAGEAARSALVEIADRLSADQAGQSLLTLLYEDAHLARLRALKEVDALVLEKPHLSTRKDDYRHSIGAEYDIAWLVDKSRREEAAVISERLQGSRLPLMSAKFMERRSNLGEPGEDSLARPGHDIFLAVSHLYYWIATTRGLENTAAFADADRMLATMCHRENGTPLSLELTKQLEALSQSHHDLTVDALFYPATYRWCFGKDVELPKTARETEDPYPSFWTEVRKVRGVLLPATGFQ